MTLPQGWSETWVRRDVLTVKGWGRVTGNHEHLFCRLSSPSSSPGLNEVERGNGQGFPSGWWRSRHVCPRVAVIHSLFLEGVPWEARGGMSAWVKKFSARKQGLFSPFPPGGGQSTSLYLSAVPGTVQGTGFGGKQARCYHLPQTTPIHLSSFRPITCTTGKNKPASSELLWGWMSWFMWNSRHSIWQALRIFKKGFCCLQIWLWISSMI